MRYLLGTFLILVSLSSIAQEETFEGLDTLGLLSKYEWLFNQIMPEQNTKKRVKHAQKSFVVHLRDSYKVFPALNNVSSRAPSIYDFEKINGKIKYLRFVSKAYRYDVINENNELVIEVRVHFANSHKLAKDIEEKFYAASEVWNEHKIKVAFPYRFRFLVVQKPELSHYSIKFVENTTGPYDIKWNPRWDHKTIAHEIGHMMGLGDEYKLLTGTRDCIDESIMCSSYKGVPMLHHYYFILRRLL